MEATQRLLTILATITAIICMILYAHSDAQVRELEGEITQDSCACAKQIQMRDSINAWNVEVNNSLIKRLTHIHN